MNLYHSKTAATPAFGRIKSRHLLKPLLLLLLLAVQSGIAQTFNPNLAAKLQQVLNSGLANNVDNRGFSASVYYPGQGIWQGTVGVSYGVPPNAQPVTPDMKFALASNTKTFTAVALLILAEDNIINLDDPISTWLPPMAKVNSHASIRQLLNHTSGIQDFYLSSAQKNTIWADLSKIWTPAEVIALIDPPVVPGSAFIYSNTNYILAGMIVQSATNQPISKLIRDRILTPLQLNNTFHAIDETISGAIAHPWTDQLVDVDLGNVRDVSVDSQLSILSATGPAGCYYSTPSDIVKFHKALWDGQIINANSLAQMTTFPPNSPTYGLGIYTGTANGRSILYHGGIVYFGRTRTLFDTHSKAVVCGLSNSNPSSIDSTSVLLHKALVDNLPASAGSIAGAATVSQGQSSQIYTIPQIANAATYTWTLPNGATGTSNTNSITVSFGTAASSGSITVKGTNLYGDGAASSLPVTVTGISLSALAGGAASINLSWSHNIAAISGFTIERSLDGISGWTVAVAGLSGEINTFTDTALAPATEYFFRVTANGAVTNITSGAVSAATKTVFRAYIDSAFPGVSDPAVIGDFADPDADDRPNLLEYALATDPATPDLGPLLQVSGLSPQPSNLKLTFKRIADPALTYAVDSSTDLATWDPTPVWTSTGAQNLAGPVTVTDNADLASTPRRFLRLRVSAP